MKESRKKKSLLPHCAIATLHPHSKAAHRYNQYRSVQLFIGKIVHAKKTATAHGQTAPRLRRVPSHVGTGVNEGADVCAAQAHQE